MKRSTWFGLFGIAVILGAIAFGIARHQPAPASADTLTAERATGSISYQGSTGRTALALLKTHASVTTGIDPSLGEYVVSVQHVTAGTNGKYWVCFVNGNAITRPDQYVTAATDTITWKLQ